MMYSNARYGNFKQSGIKNRGHIDLDMEYEIPPYEEVHFLSADELLTPQRKPQKPRQAKK